MITRGGPVEYCETSRALVPATRVRVPYRTLTPPRSLLKLTNPSLTSQRRVLPLMQQEVSIRRCIKVMIYAVTHNYFRDSRGMLPIYRDGKFHEILSRDNFIAIFR